MSKTLIAWATGILLGTASLALPAVAQTAAGGATESGARADPKKSPTAAQSKADPTQSAANARCNSRKGADQKTCLEQVRAQQQAQGGAGAGNTGTSRPPGTPVPALQTQSSAVSATGVAPSTTGPDPTPGTPAVPRK